MKYDNLNKNATIGDVYDPLVKFAKDNNPEGIEYLNAVGEFIYKSSKGACKSIESGIELAKKNLDYYCQYFNEETMLATKRFYGLGETYRTLFGKL